jgi:hypothetical protein
VGGRTPETHSQGLGQTLTLIVMMGTTEVVLCYKASSIGVRPQPLTNKAELIFHDSFGLACQALSKEGDLLGAGQFASTG